MQSKPKLKVDTSVEQQHKRCVPVNVVRILNTGIFLDHMWARWCSPVSIPSLFVTAPPIQSVSHNGWQVLIQTFTRYLFHLWCALKGNSADFIRQRLFKVLGSICKKKCCVKLSVSPERAAWGLINCLKWCLVGWDWRLTLRGMELENSELVRLL